MAPRFGEAASAPPSGQGTYPDETVSGKAEWPICAHVLQHGPHRVGRSRSRSTRPRPRRAQPAGSSPIRNRRDMTD